MAVTRVWYLLIDHKANAIGYPSRVDVPHDAGISDLLGKIQENQSHVLADVDIAALTVWKLRDPPIVQSVSRTKDLDLFLNTVSQHLLLDEESNAMSENETPARQLYYADRIAGLEAWPEDKLYIIVQLPDPSHGEKQPHSEVLKEIAGFHSQIWDKKDAHATVFVTAPIERGDPQLTNLELPSECCVMKSPSICSGSTALNGIFIRNEYILALEHIVAFSKGELFSHYPEGNDANTIMENVDEVDSTTENDDDGESGMTAEACVGAAESSVPLLQFPVTIANPFVGTDFPLKLKTLGVIITGAPGIGKSVLLEIILHLRNLAGRPTIFVLDEKTVYLFTSDGVSNVGSEIHALKLPPSVWALVDSNTDLIGVPEWVRRLGCFIVQAASTRSQRMVWKDKAVSSVSRYFMKMWSLEEVLAARMLQVNPPSESQLKIFFQLYVPSSRTAYIQALNIPAYERDLSQLIEGLSYGPVNKMMAALTSLGIDEPTPHRIFTIQPGETRDSFTINFGSQHIFEKFAATLENHGAVEARAVFELFNRNSATKGPAGMLLDRVVHTVFRQGGYWPIRKMRISRTKGKNQHYKIRSSEDYVEKYLVVGHPDRPLVWISGKRPDATTFNSFSVFRFHAGVTKLTKTGYYLPVSATQPTFGAFYYDADAMQATLLQATVSTKHDINEKGLKQLRDLGVESVCYVIVTGRQDEFDLPVPHAYGNFLKERYYLALPRVK